MRSVASLFLSAVFLAAFADASEPDSHELDASEFEIEDGLVDKIFEQNAKASRLDLVEDKTGWLVSAGLGFFNADAFSLSNPYFDVAYGDNIKALPTVRLLLAAPVVSWKGLGLFATGRVGYSFREALYTVRSKTGSSLTDSIRLHWLPLAGGVTLDYSIPHFSLLKPSIGVGAGLQWLYQQGKLDGLEQGFWIPFTFIEAAITFFPSSEWFGGVRTGATLVQSFGGGQKINGWSLDMGVQFRL